jgi:hypothetical protein
MGLLLSCECDQGYVFADVGLMRERSKLRARAVLQPRAAR